MTWSLTNVYGPQPDVDKVEFLDELRSVGASISSPWMITVDFNLLLDPTDKNRRNVNQRNMGRFRRFVEDMQLKDIPIHGRRYTWSNEYDNPTFEKLDRVLVSMDWEARFPLCFVQALSSDMSDQCPLHLA